MKLQLKTETVSEKLWSSGCRSLTATCYEKKKKKNQNQNQNKKNKTIERNYFTSIEWKENRGTLWLRVNLKSLSFISLDSVWRPESQSLSLNLPSSTLWAPVRFCCCVGSTVAQPVHLQLSTLFFWAVFQVMSAAFSLINPVPSVERWPLSFSWDSMYLGF